MKDKRNIILVLGYTDEMSNHISEKILKTYDIYDDYSIGYYNSLHETIKFIFTIPSNVILYCQYMPLTELKMIFNIAKDENYENKIIVYNFIDDLLDSSYSGRLMYFNKYNPSSYADVYYEENISTGFFKIYNDHVSKVKELCNNASESMFYKSRMHDSDKILNEDILKSYAIYYPELKKIPYFKEDGITRNKEYEDYEDTYMLKSMSDHCARQFHHYYDWKNMHNEDLIDMIEAIFDVYTAITLSLKENERLDLERFVEIIKSKGILDNIEDKVIRTIQNTISDKDKKYKVSFNEEEYLNKKLLSGRYKEYKAKDALNYIKERNEKYYEILLEETYDSKTLQSNGYFYDNITKKEVSYIDLYVNKENDNNIILAEVFENDIHIKKIYLKKGEKLNEQRNDR